MSKILAQFTISRSRDGYVLHLEDEDGDTADFNATYEQLDLISEAVEDQLNTDEEAALGLDEEEDDEEDMDDDEDDEEM
ncbi:hypothetical protein [Rhizorhapis suberifaciens]|uniref:Uncharacterized protein n=1 Tax=Rhizorhapis suberifaciens TaxID=13656 RepID=A0A840HRY9_9SPHN|nr:hypothetical protein [Rhizorhapis suberifaciens]MBB4640673.1 hypothetical protein [Rhizorhapis suberifaciens]